MVCAVRVRSAVKEGMFTTQTAFKHFEDRLRPCGHFITVGVFHCHALNLGNACLLISTQNIHLASEDVCRVVSRNDSANKLFTPDFTHRLYDVSVRRALRIPKD